MCCQENSEGRETGKNFLPTEAADRHEGLKTNTLKVWELVTSKPGGPEVQHVLGQTVVMELSPWLSCQQIQLSFDVLETFL